MSEWQPIETAPMNCDVIGFFPGADTPVMIVHFLKADDPDDEGDWYEQNTDLCPDALIVEPTHWMPVPLPPPTDTAALRDDVGAAG